MAKPATRNISGQSFYKKPETFKSEDGKTSFMEFTIEENICSGCKERNTYIEKLEAVIKSECGAEFVPPRPNTIK